MSPREISASVQGAEQSQVQGRLPTRVSNACDRCRRTKSRCDRDRPCLPCRRSDKDCVSSAPTLKAARRAPKKRQRLSSPTEPRSPAALLDSRDVQSSGHGTDSSASHLQNDNEGVASAESPPAGIPTEHAASLTPLPLSGSESVMSVTRKIFQINKLRISNRLLSAIPDGFVNREGRNTNSSDRRRPILAVLGIELPNPSEMDELVQEYFDSVHWFSLIVYEPTFRRQLESIKDGAAYQSQRGFLFLFTTMLGVASWYKSKRASSADPTSGNQWDKWKDTLLRHIESHFFELMDQTSLVAVQTCILFASYLSYHGKPNSSFALLGATTKTAQSLGLHREPPESCNNAEERKRVWWTIYTWDRFASITFGRPLGIDDNDCNVPMPLDFTENCSFVSESVEGSSRGLCYSTYQRQLNQLYMIASPVIKAAFCLRTTPSSFHGNEYASLAQQTTAQLECWRLQLPELLRLNTDIDIDERASQELKVYRQQALALQMTLDNILIVLHRPLFSIPAATLSDSRLVGPGGSSPLARTSTRADSEHGTPTPAASSETWWKVAVETSRITELPRLAQLASDGHLVAFMAINIFNAAIVLVILALSDPMSDRGQEAKRHITRIYRLLVALGERSMLSAQSGHVLQAVIRILVQREGDIMLSAMLDTGSLRPVTTATTGMPDFTAHNSTSLQDTLRLPLNTALSHSSASGNLPSENLNRHQYGSNYAAQQGTYRFAENIASVQQAFQPRTRQYDAMAGATYDQFAAFLSDHATNAPYADGLNANSEPLLQSPLQLSLQSDGLQSLNYNGLDDFGQFWLWNPGYVAPDYGI